MCKDCALLSLDFRLDLGHYLAKSVDSVRAFLSSRSPLSRVFDRTGCMQVSLSYATGLVPVVDRLIPTHVTRKLSENVSIAKYR